MNEIVDNQQNVQRRERRDAVENRERILAAARRLFAEQGVEATSMNEIAQAAQVGPGTLYRRFSHKGDLCQALLADDINAFWQRLEAYMEPDASLSALSQLGRLIDELLHMTGSHIPLLTEVLGGGGGGVKPQPHDIFRAPFYRGIHERIAHLLTQALATGETENLNVDITADIILGAVAPPLIVFQQQYRGMSMEQISASMHRLFVDGLRVRPASEAIVMMASDAGGEVERAR